MVSLLMEKSTPVTGLADYLHPTLLWFALIYSHIWYELEFFLLLSCDCDCSSPIWDAIHLTPFHFPLQALANFERHFH